MMTRRFYWILLFLIGIGPALVVANPTLAQSGYPPRRHPFVNDFAEILSAEDEAELSEKLQSLRAEQGIEGVVVTIDSIVAYQTGDPSLESFATNLFNEWGIDDRRSNDGFLILVAVDDRQVRIELGRAYGQRYNNAMQEVIDQEMVPRFRQDAYAAGILAGTEATIAALTDAGGGGLWDRIRNSRIVQVGLVGLVLAAMMLRRIRYFYRVGCLRALGQLSISALGGALLGGFLGALLGMVEVDLNAVEETVMAALTVLENGRFLREFSLFAPSTFTGAVIGAMVTVALRLINGREEGNGYGAGSSGGGGASGSW